MSYKKVKKMKLSVPFKIFKVRYKSHDLTFSINKKILITMVSSGGNTRILVRDTRNQLRSKNLNSKKSNSSGYNPANLLQPLKLLSTLPVITRQLFRQPSTRDIISRGNYCYFNSAIECLNKVEPLLNSSTDADANRNTNAAQVCRELVGIFNSFQQRNNRLVNPDTFKVCHTIFFCC